MSRWEDFAPIALDALKAQAECDDAFALFQVMTSHGDPLDEEERDMFEALKQLKAKAVRLRTAALDRAAGLPAGGIGVRS